MAIATAAGFMLVLGVLLAAILAIASRKLYVYEDPRIDEVEEMLPHANCGACGTPGCRPFAEALVKGDADPDLEFPLGRRWLLAMPAKISAALATSISSAFSVCSPCTSGQSCEHGG